MELRRLVAVSGVAAAVILVIVLSLGFSPFPVGPTLRTTSTTLSGTSVTRQPIVSTSISQSLTSTANTVQTQSGMMLTSTGAPKETKSFVLIVEDPDAPRGTFTHWIIFNVPATETGLPENVPSGTLSNGAVQGRNDAGTIGYTGPCPPSGTHHYIFHLYAVDIILGLSSGATKQDVLASIQGHILAQVDLTGLYDRM